LEYDVEKISNKIKHKRVTKKIFKYIILSVLIILFIINLILSFEENKHILGICVFNIVSESMEPALEKNDLVVVQKYQPNQFKNGDIITFKQGEKVISHRIIGITVENGVMKFQTKGDNNEIPDSEKVEAGQVYGKVVFSVGKIGKAVNYIQNARGFINIIIFVIILFILISLREKQKNNRKMRRKKYEIKKIRDNYHL